MTNSPWVPRTKSERVDWLVRWYFMLGKVGKEYSKIRFRKMTKKQLGKIIFKIRMRSGRY